MCSMKHREKKAKYAYFPYLGQWPPTGSEYDDVIGKPDPNYGGIDT